MWPRRPFVHLSHLFSATLSLKLNTKSISCVRPLSPSLELQHAPWWDVHSSSAVSWCYIHVKSWLFCDKTADWVLRPAGDLNTRLWFSCRSSGPPWLNLKIWHNPHCQDGKVKWYCNYLNVTSGRISQSGGKARRVLIAGLRASCSFVYTKKSCNTFKSLFSQTASDYNWWCERCSVFFVFMCCSDQSSFGKD